MSRSQKIMPRGTYSVVGWNYARSTKFCLYCGHRHCQNGAQEISGTKSLLKSKGVGIAKRYRKETYDISED
jgi:hypothetical protein